MAIYLPTETYFISKRFSYGDCATKTNEVSFSMIGHGLLMPMSLVYTWSLKSRTHKRLVEALRPSSSPKNYNDIDLDPIGKVVSHYYQSFVSNVKKKMISHYVNHCSTLDCYSCNNNLKNWSKEILSRISTNVIHHMLTYFWVLYWSLTFFHPLLLLLFFIFNFLFCISLSIIVIFLQSYFILKILT